MKKTITSLARLAPISLLLLTSCAHQFAGLDLVRPPMTGHAGPTAFYLPPTTVESLQPSLEWKPSREPSVTYDVIVYAGVKNVPLWLAGKQIYYREGITTTTHVIEEPLSPHTVYVWSVRTRSGAKTSPWSTYSDSGGFIGFMNGSHRSNILWAFQTPDK